MPVFEGSRLRIAAHNTGRADDSATHDTPATEDTVYNPISIGEKTLASSEGER